MLIARWQFTQSSASLSKLQIRTPEVFAPLLEPARYKGAHGGRGSGKSHFFAELGVEDALRLPGEIGEGMRMACIREVQKSLKQSAKRLFEDKLQKFGLGEAQGFKVFNEVIQTPKDGLITFTGMQDHTADSVKSMEGFHRAFVEEAQSLSERSLMMLRPTIRAEGKDLRGGDWQSELWFSWNPARATDAVDRMLRGPNVPTGATVVHANWNNNPWFPKVLEQERLDCLENEPEKYGHIWDGDYARVWEGAYFAKHLTTAEQEGRIGFIGADPLMGTFAFWDIGSSSQKSDATSIWIGQIIGEEIRVLDYYEAVGQPLAAHVNWLRSAGYGDATCILPHDGKKHDTVYAVTVEGALRESGFEVQTVPNQGRGAAMQRVEACRRMFSRIRFNREKTEGGREALGWYHEKRDEVRNIGLGPNHDWASHAADAFGLMCVWVATRHSAADKWGAPLRRNLAGVSW